MMPSPQGILYELTVTTVTALENFACDVVLRRARHCNVWDIPTESHMRFWVTKFASLDERVTGELFDMNANVETERTGQKCTHVQTNATHTVQKNNKSRDGIMFHLSAFEICK